MDLAVQVLAVRRDINELKAQVERMRTAKPRRAFLLRAIGLARVLGRFLGSKPGQALIAILGPAAAALFKWLTGRS